MPNSGFVAPIASSAGEFVVSVETRVGPHDLARKAQLGAPIQLGNNAGHTGIEDANGEQ